MRLYKLYNQNKPLTQKRARTLLAIVWGRQNVNLESQGRKVNLN